MQNVSLETIRIPKWLIILMVFGFLLVPMGSAFATTGSAVDIKTQVSTSTQQDGYYYITTLKNYQGSDGIATVTLPNSNYSIRILNSDGSVKYSGGTNYTYGGTYTWNMTVGESLEIKIHGGYDTSQPFLVYNGEWQSYATYNGSEVPLMEPPPVWVQETTVEEIPQTILNNLHGGLLGLGLTILAIMLGVSLVPRLIYSLAR